MNPLLDFSDFPQFQNVQPLHMKSAIDTILYQNELLITDLLRSQHTLNWKNFMIPFDEINDRLERVWAKISHLNSVKDSEEYRPVYQDCIQKITEYADRLKQNKDLFKKIKSLYEQRDTLNLNQSQIKCLKNHLKDFKRSGIELNMDQRTRYRLINSQLSKFETRFSQHVLDATDGWTLHIQKEHDLDGLPKNLIDLAKSQAKQIGKSGWLFTLQDPSYLPFMAYSDNAELRKQMYHAYITRASELGPNGGKWDNSEVIHLILRLRQEKANLLGFENYAEYSLHNKMASSCKNVEHFLLDLLEISKSIAKREMQALKKFAKEEYQVPKLSAWDYAWFSEKFRQKKYNISQEKIRRYFPVTKVLSGMFIAVKQLFGIHIEAAEYAPKMWNKDAMFFKVTHENGQLQGYFYVDLFARKSKHGGAWMADLIGRRRTLSGIQFPVACLVCNFSANKIDGIHSLLTHEEVITLFHEFGHILHHILTKVDVAGVAGMNGIPCDAVEFPSQFLENWCWEKETLDLISQHIETGNPISDKILVSMRQVKTFQSAMQIVRQIELSLFDLKIHQDIDLSDDNSVQTIFNQIRKLTSIFDVPVFNRFQHSFLHIFSGEYAAGYYGYQWSEMLSADAYSLFEENGIFDKSTGRLFLKTIFEKGGSEDPMTLFQKFRGRPPSIEAMLYHSGLHIST